MAFDNQVINLSFIGLLEQIGGVRAEPFDPDVPPVPARKENSSTGTAYYGIDQFGREVFLPIKLSYTDENNTERVLWLYHSIIGINGGTRDIDTPMTEREGTFTEIASNDDWGFDIIGYLVTDTNDFPEADFKDLVALKKFKGVVHIVNAITDMVLLDKNNKGYDTIRIKNIEFPAVKGIQNVRPFTIRARQDIPFNLYEIE